MATDGTLLQGEVSSPTDNPLLDGAFVENLLAGFLKSLVLEQLTDSRKEAGPVTIRAQASASAQKPPMESNPEPKDLKPSTEGGKPHLKFIRGGKAGNA